MRMLDSGNIYDTVVNTIQIRKYLSKRNKKNLAAVTLISQAYYIYSYPALKFKYRKSSLSMAK